MYSHNDISKFLIVLLGPTGVGKTDLSIKLSKFFNAPILSADSRQIFKEMKIGTACPSPNQLSEAPHYFIGHKNIADRYSCGMFEMDALKQLDSIFLKGNFALLVGGSMLYIDAVCKGIDDFPTPDPELRQSLEDQLKQYGIENLRAQLKLLDPEHYHQIDLKNSQRVLKAVEVCLQTGKPYSSFLTQPMKKRSFTPIKIGINLPREELYEKINCRVDRMISMGLVDEVKKLAAFKSHNALKTVGYKEIFDHLEGKNTLEQAIELIKRNSRRYAKRQLTWWAKDKDINWFNPNDIKGIVEYIEYVSRIKV
jgi:tRNA dimethylallyltransferase